MANEEKIQESIVTELISTLRSNEQHLYLKTNFLNWYNDHNKNIAIKYPAMNVGDARIQPRNPQWLGN